MNLHEYQAKQLFKQYDLPVSEGVVCQTADEAEMALFQLKWRCLDSEMSSSRRGTWKSRWREACS